MGKRREAKRGLVYSKDKRDLYYRKAKEEGYRARSAYKLLQLNDNFHFLDDPSLKRVVDLCAAPGSWSQVLSRKLFEGSDQQDRRIVAVDLQTMSPIDHVTTLQADITHPRTLQRILQLFGDEPADLVISDGAPDVTGLHDLDEYVQQQLVMSALQLACCVLKPNGSFIAKVFRGRDIDLLYSQLACLFTHVTCAKPRSSRSTSLEAFVVCQGYQPPADWTPKLDPSQSVQQFFQHCLPNGKHIAPFMACGSLESFDSDATYTSTCSTDPIATGDKHKPSLNPVQQPTNPPYKQALLLKRQGRLSRHVR